MAFQTRCPECQAKLTLEDTPDADESIECPKCGNQFMAKPLKKKKADDGGDKGDEKGGEKPAKKGDKKKDKGEKGGKTAEAGPKKRKTKKKKSNKVIMILMAAGGLGILTCVALIGYLVLGKVSKVDEALSHVPGDFNHIRGMNVGLIARYPGYLTELTPQFNVVVKDVATELAAAAPPQAVPGIDDAAIAFTDYAIHAKRKVNGGVNGQVVVIRTREKINFAEVGPKLGAAANIDGVPCFRSSARGLMNNAMIFSPNNRLIVVVLATGQQDAVLRTSMGGPKAKDTTRAGKLTDAGKKISSGHLWTMVVTEGDLAGYAKAIGDSIKKDFPKVAGALQGTKVYGTWMMFGTAVRVGVGCDADTRDTASEIATSLKEGPLGKGDDSEMPNESKKVVSNHSSKEFKAELMANIKYSYTGTCVYAESKVNFEKAKPILSMFNRPDMADAAPGK
ncbi:zinc ribbon domain-containing protein [Limnoglobus roseus]|uniref:Uncharacterized protein n=1 Tax=Limnoglobus roseus TaxID=2598579 RepID=A0A5C1AER0_9BACT|nr:hypothetical protein [Limnoglobus roseus]QEL16182.1 hypothetical protein PX52LOC_03122 [Limnoglobus roseus]